jgi:acylphosphatase
VSATCVDLRITGRVQGVFFRDSCATEARRLGVTGWVSNEDDGSVHAHLEGPAQAVDELVAWCHDGPPRARVDDVRVQAGRSEHCSGFESR